MSTQTEQKPANSTDTKPAENKATKPDFGKGRFSPEMERIYLSCVKLLSIPEPKAEKIARQAGSDAGAVLSHATASLKVSKATKDGKTTISDASKLKGVTMTYPLSIVRAIQWIEDAGSNGISYGHTQWRLHADIQKWVDELKVESAG